MKRWAVLAGQLALTVLVTWAVVNRVGLGLDELATLGPGAWIPASPLLAIAASALLAVGYFFSAALWGRIVVDLGGPRLPAWDAVRLFMIANLGRYVPGKVWQIAGLAALARARGVAPVTATGAAILGQGVALAAATLVGLGALLGGNAAMRTLGVAGGLVVVTGLVLMSLPMVFDPVARLWFRMARQEPPEGLANVHGLRWMALYVANWALYAFAFWLLVASFGYEVSMLPVASAFAAAYVVGYIAIFAPAGIGVREASLAALLAAHLGLGPAGAVAIIARVWTTLVEVLPAGAFWVGYMGARGGSGHGMEMDGE